MDLCRKCNCELVVGGNYNPVKYNGKICIHCKKQYRHEQYIKNCEKCKRYDKEYYKNNKDKKKIYYEKNKEHIKIRKKEYDKAYRAKNIEKIREYTKNNKEQIKKYRENNKDYIDQYNKEYYKNNKDKKKEYKKNFYKINLNNKLSIILRSRIYKKLKYYKKSGSAVRDLGCTIDELKVYLESKFQEGMSWDNWRADGWHLDHIIPLSSFDLTDREQFLKACHYTNLQPLWAEENLKKSNKIITQQVNI